MKRAMVVFGLLVLSGGVLKAETSVSSYCQTHCQAAEVRAQINDLERGIRRDEVNIAGTKFIAADRIRGELAEKKVRLAELKKRLTDLEAKLASKE